MPLQNVCIVYVYVSNLAAHGTTFNSFIQQKKTVHFSFKWMNETIGYWHGWPLNRSPCMKVSVSLAWVTLADRRLWGHTVLITLHFGFIQAQLWISILKWRRLLEKKCPDLHMIHYKVCLQWGLMHHIQWTSLPYSVAPVRLHTCSCPPHLRDLSRSLAACAALSSPVGSKLLHLSLALSPPPPEPPAGGGGGGGGTGPGGGPSGCPLLRPKSHDILAIMYIKLLRQAGQKNDCQPASSTCEPRRNPLRNCRRPIDVRWTTAVAIGHWQWTGFFIGSCNSCPPWRSHVR